MCTCLDILEVFYVSETEANDRESCFWNTEDDESTGEGWYYWFCFPGCLPEGDAPMGPFATEAQAESDARDTFCDHEDEDEDEDES